MPLKNYIRLGKSISNWPVYFKKKFQDAVYITRGAELKMEVPKEFFYVFKEIFMEDFYSIDRLLKHIPDKSVILDIGGNAGYFSFLIASRKRNAEIFAFEPIAENISVFRSNIKRNLGLENRLHLEQKAVTGKKQLSVSLFFDNISHNTVVASVYPEFSDANKKEIRIDAISLAEIIEENKLARIDLIKLDCEGSEYPILYDSPSEVWPVIRCLAVEVHELDADKKNFRCLYSFLQGKGFQIHSRLDPNGCHYVMAHK